MTTDLTWEVSEALGTPVLLLHCHIGSGFLLRLDPVAWGMLGLLSPCCKQDYYADYAVGGRLVCDQCGKEYFMEPPARCAVSDTYSYSYEFEFLELWIQWAGLSVLNASLAALDLEAVIRQVLIYFTPQTSKEELLQLLPTLPTQLHPHEESTP